MSKYELMWESPLVGFYWHYNFIHKVYESNILEKFTGFQEKNFCSDNFRENYRFFILQSDLEYLHNKYRVFIKNNDMFLKWANEVDQNYSNILSLSWEDDESKQLTELINDVNDLESIFHNSVGLHLVSQPHLIKALELDLSEMLNKTGLTQKEELIQFGTLSKEIPKVLQEQYEWLQLICMSFDSSSPLHTLFSNHLKKWAYISAGDSHQPMSLKLLISRYETDSKDPEQIYKQLRSYEERTKKIEEMRSIEKQMNDPEISFLLERIRILSSNRFKTKESWMKLWYLIEKKLDKISDLLGEDVINLTLNEIIEVEKCKNVDRKTYFYTSINGRKSLYYNKTDEYIRNQFLEDIDYGKISCVVGDCGYPGRVIGMAVCLDWNDKIEDFIHLINGDSILVVPQTTPAFVPALSICKGLVADEGGIAGHASIVSRELNLISLIGTKIGTKVFKTGDLICIDTNTKTAFKVGGKIV